MLVLVVEDDPSYSEIIGHTLRRASYEVVTVGSVHDATAFAHRKLPDLAVLDVSLPDGTGMDVCGALRELHPGMPILMLSALDRSSDIVSGLESGADDYLTKPFHPNELVARTKALSRRAGAPAAAGKATNRVSSHGIEVDPDSQVAYLHGVDLGCTKIETDILTQLIRYPGQALTHAFLTEVVRGYKNMPDATLLKGHISSVRKKIRAAGGDPRILRTVHGVGYSFSPE